MVSENEWIAIVSLISSSVAILSAGVLGFDWKRTRKRQRMEWSIAMFSYAIGHFIVFLIYWYILSGNKLIITGKDLEFWDVKTWVWIYINLSGALTMALILKGLLPLFTEKQLYKNGAPILFALIYFIGTTAYAFFLEDDNPLKFIMLGKLVDDSKKYTQYNNMSWWAVECLIPISFLIGVLFFLHYRDSEMLSSLLISIHFLGYALLLFIWPFEDLKLQFYVGRTIITTILTLGFIDLMRKTPVSK